mmetsp:Transcript_44173/g.147320  ORF Transcript_44173/g.147320 Transcript_44173/m.147320 type:complete len:82 (+) Transcript_44173:13-258(+)
MKSPSPAAERHTLMREKQEDAAEVAAAVITYCFCSGGMLVINKAVTTALAFRLIEQRHYSGFHRACTSHASLQPRQPASAW